MRPSLFLFAIAFFGLMNCNGQASNLPNNFDYGSIHPTKYINKFFKIEIPINPEWVVQTDEQVRNLSEVGKDIISGDNEDLKSIVEAAEVNSAYLLTVFKYEVGAAVEFNPSYMLLAENISGFPGIKTGDDYLFHAKKLLQQSQMDYTFKKNNYERRIGSQTFVVMEATLNYLDQTIIQEYHSTIMNGFALSIIVTSASKQDQEELLTLLKRIKI